METLIMHPKNKAQLSALKAIAKALEVKFETSPYDPEFVEMIKESRQQADSGQVTIIDPTKSIWDNLK